jgi:ATP-dependent protease ClpP protease subunit
MDTPATQPASPDVYVVFVDDINQVNTNRIVAGLTVAMAQGHTRVHVMFQSFGGFVGDGIMLYNLFRTMTSLQVSLYNAGQVSSAAVIAYLGAKRRVATRNSVFMLHRPHNSPQFASATKLAKLAESLMVDDKRTEEILRAHIKMPDESWKHLENNDLYLTGEEAVKYGIATELGEFSPPPGTPIYKL